MDKRIVLLLIFGAVLSAPARAAGPAPTAAQDAAVTIKDIEPFPYCAIGHTGPYTDMTAGIGPLIGAMQAQELFTQVRGPMVGVYYNSPGEVKPEELSWEVGFVITAQATPQLPLVKKTWDHTTVAAALHIGPYEKVGRTIEKVMAWLAAQGYEASGPMLERYLNMNPTAVKPEELRTEIWVPCQKK
jgi:effector-binding domain-containing protein